MENFFRFDAVKLSGLGLVTSSSDKYKGETKISQKGRKRLRYLLFQVVKSTVAPLKELKKLHVCYTAINKNSLKKMIGDIKHPNQQISQVA